MRRFYWIIQLILLMLPTLAAAKDVVSYRLPNGLELFVQEDHRAPVVVSQVWYKVGSSYEPNGITGISHALEHMMFKGTALHGPGEFSRIIAENGGEENAFTDRDYTGYYQVMDKSKLPISFELEADRMRNLVVSPSEFAKEIQVVMEERRMRTDDNPEAVVYERFLAAGYVSTSYHHMPIGWMSDLQHMTAEDLHAWYQKWYAPNNAILVVVGDVNPEEVHQLAQKYFGPLKASSLPVVKPEREVSSLGPRSMVIKVPAELPWMIMGYNVPTLKSSPGSNDPYVLSVIAAILDVGNSSRFSKNLVRGKQIAAEVNVEYEPTARLSTLFKIEATPAQGHTVAEVKAALLEELNKLQTTPVTAEELARVKAGVIADKVYSKDSIANQAHEIGSLEAVGLSWRLRDEYVGHISAVTPAQIQEVAKQYFSSNNLTFAELKPLPLTKDQEKKTHQSTPLREEHVH